MKTEENETEDLLNEEEEERRSEERQIRQLRDELAYFDDSGT